MKRRRRVTRWVIVATLLLIGGAIVNVAVAWALVLTAPTWTTSDPPLFWSDAQRTWRVRFEPSHTVRRTLMAPTSIRMTDEQIGQKRDLDDADLAPHVLARMFEVPPAEEPEALTFWHVGWPGPALRCMQFAWRGTKHDTRLPGPGFDETRAEDAIVFFRGYEPVILPMRPMLAGFALNSFVYATLIWLLLAAPFALRRHRRIRRGLCPKCGYDLRGHGSNASACPECGAHVQRTASTMSAASLMKRRMR